MTCHCHRCAEARLPLCICGRGDGLRVELLGALAPEDDPEDCPIYVPEGLHDAAPAR